MTEYKCGDCFHADLCEESKMLVGFSRDNPAYCGMFLNCADVVPARRGRWDDEHKCTVCRNEAFCKISNIQPDYDYDWEENLVETGGYIWNTEWLETTYCPHCGAKMDGGAD